MTRETKLGLFLLVGVFCLALSIFLLGDFSFQNRYFINVLFNDVTGLPDKGKVRIAGVEVGGVSGVELEDGKAKVRVWLKRNIVIHGDAEARIASTGIIGSKYLELTMGSAAAPVVEDGGVVIGTDPMSLENMLSTAMEKLGSVVDAFTGEDSKNMGKNLSATMDNLKKITDTLRLALYEQDKKISEIIDNFHSFSEDMAGITAENKENLAETIKNIRDISEKLDKFVQKIDKGDGTIGKLVSDEEMGNQLKETVTDIRETSKEARRVLKRLNYIETKWDYTLRYDGKYKFYRYDVGLQVSPTPGKFYYLGASNVGDKPDNVYDPEEQTTFNFLLGKTFGAATVYGGAIRSKGGVGVKVKPLWKWDPWRRLEVKAEAYHFSRNTPVSKPKVNIGGQVEVTKWASFGAQVEDVYSESSVNTYMNLQFKDDDIAYVLGIVGLAKP
ncbi:MAG TPA: hypothetical protein DEE98_01480 [Elusimicrobia bacterium]|nr:MAG: hypothetical protein A2278_06235 [Elusimicrobia bacterium RIFOXYA12_FULL_49_49]OGS09718.1 MAG: hypothetical protein A2386_05625 [Elusimicrobia bacterium RIFOXYB1_FULL_48_9]OGS10271.1 MAG: hypothetical protein A2204_01600 [Elusimicrobia bacterium RIFOXYA1_FULL_47_7]OGS16610.1 MAG: hypothetical protein A2251_04500 [Elusimicrobia bacterium RIFOXYA2_FULL_47_53]OGS25817.1 MAG: hypothetical protein A2339_00020 [Elusimicrobia bacterium RIFOXYB12_FULL_50_12]OGS31588.1 MAG: hypothetical protein